MFGEQSASRTARGGLQENCRKTILLVGDSPRPDTIKNPPEGGFLIVVIFLLSSLPFGFNTFALILCHHQFVVYAVYKLVTFGLLERYPLELVSFVRFECNLAGLIVGQTRNDQRWIAITVYR